MKISEKTALSNYNTERLFEWRAPRCWGRFVKRKLSESKVRAWLAGFDTFAAFHACRPASLESYYENGLQLADHASLTAAARKIFVTDEFREISATEFDAITNKISQIDNRKTYAVLDDDELVRFCGHYLIYGSEHIGGIAASLIKDGRRDYRQILKRFGKPTVFRLELPREFIPPDQLLELAESLTQTAEDFVGCEEPPYLSWSFIFDRAVPSEYVVSHYHPEAVPDPLLRYMPYRFREDGSFYESF
jgi:hypothetical protein